MTGIACFISSTVRACQRTSRFETVRVSLSPGVRTPHPFDHLADATHPPCTAALCVCVGQRAVGRDVRGPLPSATLCLAPTWCACQVVICCDPAHPLAEAFSGRYEARAALSRPPVASLPSRKKFRIVARTIARSSTCASTSPIHLSKYTP